MDLFDNETSNKIVVPESILKRNSERQEKILKRKEEEANDSSSQHIDYFNNKFKNVTREIEESLENCDSFNKSELYEVFGQIYEKIQLLHKYLSASAIFLRPYDSRMCKATIQRLTDAVQSTEERLLPKKKFGFKKRNEKVIEKSVVDGGNKLLEPYPVFAVKLDGLGFWDRSDEVLHLTRDSTSNQDITLSNLKCCTVVIHGSPNTVFLNSITNCTILTGPVRTSILLYVCQNSVIAAMCQQMRIHKTESSDFYIHVTTKAIIEDSTNVRFAPYNYSYEGIENDINESTLDVNSNNWEFIDDFNWLVHNRKSPNWSIIPEEERKTSWQH